MTTIRVLCVLLLCLGATVSRSPFCAHAEAVQAQPAPPSMPPPGNPGHKPPPEGAYCDRSKHAARECKCHAKCVEDEAGNITVVEDSKNCRAYCFKSHCHCPHDCE